MRKYRDYTDEQIVDYAKDVKSIAGLLKKLNLKVVGGNYYTIKKNIQRLKVDTSHWTGNGWNKNKQLKDWSQYTKSSHLKKHLIDKRGNRCESCLLEIWMNTKIPLELHHIDGCRTNNTLDNLQLLCCNCHGLTSTWRGRKFAAVV